MRGKDKYRGKDSTIKNTRWRDRKEEGTTDILTKIDDYKFYVINLLNFILK
jgi:hypothetical protein